MKKLLPFLLFVILSTSSRSQIVFCPPGAEWNYLFHGAFYHPAMATNESVKYVRDSILDNDTVKVLSHTNFFLFCSVGQYTTVLKQKGDTVFFRNIRTQNSWQILYNFAAQPGDSWSTSLSFEYTSTLITRTYTVLSVDTVNINGFNLRRLHVAPGGWASTQYITERLGPNAFLFNYLGNNLGYCDYGHFNEFICYRDSSFGIYQIGTKPCDFDPRVFVSVYEQTNLENIKIFPNPVKDVLSIETGIPQDVDIRFYDVSGREIKHVKLNTGEKINISDLSPGLYLLSLNRDKEVIYTTKLIKED